MAPNRSIIKFESTEMKFRKKRRKYLRGGCGACRLSVRTKCPGTAPSAASSINVCFLFQMKILFVLYLHSSFLASFKFHLLFSFLSVPLYLCPCFLWFSRRKKKHLPFQISPKSIYNIDFIFYLLSFNFCHDSRKEVVPFFLVVFPFSSPNFLVRTSRILLFRCFENVLRDFSLILTSIIQGFPTNDEKMSHRYFPRENWKKAQFL